jgi:hypothetical protein
MREKKISEERSRKSKGHNTDSYEEQVEDLEPQENNDQQAVQDPIEKEIEEEIDKLKDNKNTGENGILTEILKYVGGRLKSRVSALIKRIWQEERMPQQ